MTHAEHYRELAVAAEAEAAAATLDQVRERNLRSAAAWHQIADRAERTERMRAERMPTHA